MTEQYLSRIHAQQSSSNNNHTGVDQHYLVQSGNEYKCICQMCSCGRHRCPRHQIKGDFETSYNNHYKKITQKVAATQPPQYVYKERHYHPDTLRTRYKETYTEQKPLENQQLTTSRLQNLGRSVLRPHIPFNGNTSYQEQYKPFSLEIAPNPEQDPFTNLRDKNPDYGLRYPAKFNDETSYKDHYQQPMSPQKVQKSPYPEYRKPEVPFYGSSSYNDQFKGYKLLAQQYEAYSQSLMKAPRVPFEGHTTYKEMFKGFKVEVQQSGGKKCSLEETNLPQTNFLNSSPHVYYNDGQRKYL